MALQVKEIHVVGAKGVTNAERPSAGTAVAATIVEVNISFRYGGVENSIGVIIPPSRYAVDMERIDSIM